MSLTKYFASSFAWGIVAKLTDALVKFVTIPLLLHYFGKENYGLLTLAIATNAYMALLDLGINTGAIKYFSQWIADKKTNLIDSVARTSISFYLIIGTINALLLIILAIWGGNLFKVNPEQFNLLQALFIILAIFSILNWASSVFNQLLIANEKIGYIQQINIAKTILQLALVIYAIHSELSLINYFFFFLLINSFVVIPAFLHAKKAQFITSIKPKLDWQNFKPILIYSLAIFVMGLFQYTATQSRPIILGIFTTSGIEILSEYRIIEVFPIFVISIGGMVTSILLPQTSKMVHAGERDKIETMAYRGTALTSIIVCLLTFPIIVASKSLISMYVGQQYSYLSTWLSLWLLTLVLYLNSTPVASLVLATGKTKMLVYSSAISCVISIFVNAILCPTFGVGSAVMGYLVYIIIQMSFYYFYFNTKVLQLDSLKVFRSFAIPAAIGFLLAVPLYFVQLVSLSAAWIIGIKVILWLSLFCGIIFLFNFGSIREEIAKLMKNI